MKIGITERGDAGLDLSWKNKVNNMDMSILITKQLSLEFCDAVRQSSANLIIHVGCTGWGGTWLEPNVPDYMTQLLRLKFLTAFMPIDRFVLRVDPIIPNEEGLCRMQLVLDKAAELGLLPGVRVRISVLDEYSHVKKRLSAAGKPTFYQSNTKYPSRRHMDAVKTILEQYPNVTFETCAEPYLLGDNIEQVGCVSEKDLAVFGLKPDTTLTNPQNRTGCLCLCNKTELLTNKKRCPHKCMYCYWTD